MVNSNVVGARIDSDLTLWTVLENVKDDIMDLAFPADTDSAPAMQRASHEVFQQPVFPI